jgi:hypothetical protein
MCWASLAIDSGLAPKGLFMRYVVVNVGIALKAIIDAERPQAQAEKCDSSMTTREKMRPGD